MNCPKCGKENPDNSQFCRFCSCVLAQSQACPDTVVVKTSKVALAALVLGVLSPFTCGITAIPAIVLGIISLVQTWKSGGRLTGTGPATVGILASVFGFFVLTWFFLPALAKTREMAFRQICGMNLSGIGKAMLIYANDYGDKFPRAGGKDSTWAAKISNWQAADRATAFDLQPDGTGGQASISSSLYLLVRHGYIEPIYFCCRGDRKAKRFRPVTYGEGGKEFIDLWDFGPQPWRHVSYSYHTPYGRFPLTTSSNQGMAVAADRNPWIDSPFAKARDFGRFKPDISPWSGTSTERRCGNTYVHHEDGQNVVFLDSHVGFEPRSYCGLNDDNIYTYWSEGDMSRGVPPQVGSEPASREDSLLVHDPPTEEPQAKRRWRWLW